GLETILAMAQILDQTLSRLRQSTHVRTLVEVALVRLCKLDDLDALPRLVAELSGVGGGGSGVGGQESGDTPRGAAKPVVEAQKKTPEVSEVASARMETGAQQANNLDDRSAAEFWQQTLAEIGDMT